MLGSIMEISGEHFSHVVLLLHPCVAIGSIMSPVVTSLEMMLEYHRGP